MVKGAGSAPSGRRWGRAGVLMLGLLAACSASTPSTAPRPAASRSVGADGIEAPTDEAIPPAPAAFTGAPPPPVPAPQLNAPLPTAGGVWAVIVGINRYPGTGHDLRSARNDAADMDAVLAGEGVPPERRLRLADGQASAAVLRRSLDWLVAHAGPDATVVFFYAGHVRTLRPGTEALVGSDGGLVTDQEVADHLRGLRAARTWLVIAGCYGGGFTEALAPGRILTAAAPAGQLAYESDTFHRSYLVEYMLHQAILQGRAGSSVEAAFAWASETLRRDHPDRLPVQYDELAGGLSLAAFHPPAPAPADPAPPPSSSPPTTQLSSPPADEPRPPPNNSQSCVLTIGSTVGCPSQ